MYYYYYLQVQVISHYQLLPGHYKVKNRLLVEWEELNLRKSTTTKITTTTTLCYNGFVLSIPYVPLVQKQKPQP